VNLPEAMAEAIRAGMGIGMLPVHTALQGLREGTLRQVLPEVQLRPYSVYAIYASRQFLDAEIRALLDFLRETLPRNLERQEQELLSLTKMHTESLPHLSRVADYARDGGGLETEPGMTTNALPVAGRPHHRHPSNEPLLVRCKRVAKAVEQ
jgi:LysR substrate binding domain